MRKIILYLGFILVFFIVKSQQVALEVFATNFSSPVEIMNAGDSRLFIVEKQGVIKILNSDGTTNSTPFLNIVSKVNSSANERGLLGLAFHPDYTTNGKFYLYYINASGNTVVAKYNVSTNSNIADPNSESILMTITQPYSNHNGGHIAFGPDGYLYIGMGDGGSGGDPQNNSQNGQSLLGKLLRIDVDNGSPYSTPSSNPYVGNTAFLDEIYAYGLRNPWKFSFDIPTGDIWIADVGQNSFEEVNHLANSSAKNFGWRCYEGNSIYNNSNCPSSSTMTFPVATYALGGSPYKCAITGGYVYNGSEYPNFNGLYFFSDYCSSEIGTINPTNNTTTFYGPFTGNLATFGLDNNQNLYVAGIINGIIYKVIDETLAVEDLEPTKTYRLNFNNPASDNLILNSNNTIKELKIIDLSGRVILQKLNVNTKDLQINLSDISTGQYQMLIQLVESNQLVSKPLLIK